MYGSVNCFQIAREHADLSCDQQLCFDEKPIRIQLQSLPLLVAVRAFSAQKCFLWLHRYTFAYACNCQVMPAMCSTAQPQAVLLF